MIIKFFKKESFLIFFQRIIQSTSGLVFLLLISFFVSIENQAWYYVFLSLASFYTLFDLGLSNILVHFYASKKLSKYSEKIYNLILLERRYFILAFFYFLSLVSFGALYLTSIENNHINWKLPYFVLIFSYSFQLFLLPRMAFIEGMGYIKNITKMRIFQLLLSTSITSFALINNNPLWAAAIYAFINALVPILWSYRFLSSNWI